MDDFIPFSAFITFPDIQSARKIADLLLDQKACACAQIIPGIESHYFWEGKKESSAEVLMILKTDQKAIPIIKRVVQDAHPYEIPQVIFLQIKDGLESYLQWMKSQLA